MKFNINGYSQQKLIEYSLDVEDSLILRILADMYVSEKMEYKIMNENKYMWCSYGFLLEQIPILGTKRTLIRKIDNLIEKGILTKEVITSRKGRTGKFLYITFSKNYSDLTEYTPSDKMSSDQVTNCHQPSDKMSSDQVTNCHIKDYSINNNSINNSISSSADDPAQLQPTQDKNLEVEEFVEDMKELRDIVAEVTKQDKGYIENLMTPYKYKGIIKELLVKIKASDFLMGRKKEKPKLVIFTRNNKITEILTGAYDDFEKEKPKNERVVNNYSEFNFDV